MEYTNLVKLVGQDWADFMKDFMCPDATGKCHYDEIGNFLKTQYDGGIPVFPDKRQVFRAFQETPLASLRVIILNEEPYPKAGYNNGLALSTDNPKIPVSLVQLYDGIEKDVYNGLDVIKPNRTGVLGRTQTDGSVKTWTSQGVLLLNSSLTVEADRPGAHTDIWRPFIDFIVTNLWKIKRNLVFISWGNRAKDVVQYRTAGDKETGVNIFHAFTLSSEHPTAAAKAKRQWTTDNFSRTNLIIKVNGLGEPIEW